MAKLSKPNRATKDVGSSQELTDQAKVFATRMRLQNTVDQADALDAIREVAGNLIGTEEVAVFKVDPRRSELWLYWSFGVDPNKYALLDVRQEPRLHPVLAGETVFREHANDRLLSTEDPASALVPILVDGKASAVIVLFRLFPHKPGIEQIDRQICEVLSHCAGRAVAPYHQKQI